MKKLVLWLLLAVTTCCAPAWATNTHGTPDSAREQQYWFGDTGMPYMKAGCEFAVPSSSLTLGAVACSGYVQHASGYLVYANQVSKAVGPLSGGDGTYWIALHADSSTTVAGWTRQGGTHYVWKKSATRPADAAGLLIVRQVTVAGSVVTAVAWPLGLCTNMACKVIDVTDPAVGAVCDGTTDDVVALQRALNMPGTITLPPGKTCLARAANLYMRSQSTLVIPVTAELWLDTHRLIAFNQDDLMLTGGGRIRGTNTNKTEPRADGTPDPSTCGVGIPYAWGLITFYSDTSLPHGGWVIENLDIMGDFNLDFLSTPNGVQDFWDQGILFANVKDAWIRNNRVSHFQGEMINLNQGCATTGATNVGIWIVDNNISWGNHDGISTTTLLIYDLFIMRNYIRQVHFGLETQIGLIDGNIVDSAEATGIACGGNSYRNTKISNNVVRNAKIGYELSCSGINLGPIQVTGNVAETSQQFGFYVTNMRDLHFVGNTVSQAGLAAGTWASMAFSILSSAYIADNFVTNPGQFATTGIDIGASSGPSVPSGTPALGNVVVGSNAIDGHLVRYNISGTSGTRNAPAPHQGTYSAVNSTATTSLQALRTIALEGGSLYSSAGFHMRAWGISNDGGTTSTKTIQLRLGTDLATSQVIAQMIVPAGGNGSWILDVDLGNTGATNVQEAAYTGYFNDTLVKATTSQTTATVSALQNLYLAVTLANSGATIQSTGFTVRHTQATSLQ